MDNDSDKIDLLLRGIHIEDYNFEEEETPKIWEEKNKNSEKESTNNLNQETNNKELKYTTPETVDEIKKELENKQNNEKLNSEKSEEIIKNKIKEQEKQIDENFPQYKNSLDFVKYLEIQRLSGKILNEMQSFILENYRKENHLYEVSEIKSLSELNKEIEEIDITFMYNKKDIISLYSKNGNILILSTKEQKFVKRITPKNVKNSYINCMDITDDLQELICGYQDGTIEVINIQSGDSKYTNNKVHKDSSCIELKIYKKDKEKNEIYFVSSGGNGQVFYNTLKMGLTRFLWRLYSSPITTENKYPIFMIKYILNYNLSEIYVILGSLEEISIWCVEPSIDKLFSFQKPNYIGKNMVPDAQVGIGGLPEKYLYGIKEEYNNLLLIISWENVIYFYQLKIDKNIICKYIEIGNYINSGNILRIGFLNNSVIYCFDDKLAIKLINSTKINIEKIELSKDDQKPIIPDKNNYAEIEGNKFFLTSISEQTKLHDNDQNPIKTYLYSIIENDSFLFLFGNKQIFKYQLSQWETFINNFKKKEDFLNLFSIGIELYKGNFKALSSIPKNDVLKIQVGAFLRQIISQYVIINIGETSSQDIAKIGDCTKITIEFCIEIEAVEFLLNSILPSFEAKEYDKLFLEKLIAFVLTDKIANFEISSNIILNLIGLYYKYGMQEILGKMLLHINIKSIDTIEIKNKLEEMGLSLPLTYLYINGENQDYFYPLQKMFDIFHSKTYSSQVLIDNEENNSINYSKCLNEKLISLEEVLNSKEYAGHVILWYIRWILSEKKFPDEMTKIEKNVFDNLVPKIAYWLLTEKVISDFLKIDPKYYFIIQKNIFSIKKHYELLVNSANDPKIKIPTLASLLTTVVKLNDIHPSSLIDYMVSWCKVLNENKIYFYLYDFIIGISNINIIKKELKVESVSFILKHYTEINNIIYNSEIIMLIKQIIDFLNEEFSEEDIGKIISSIVDHNFDEIKLFLLNKKNSYKEIIEFYLDEKSNLKDRIKRLFEWLNIKLDEVINTENYFKFSNAIKDNIFQLSKASMNDFFKLSLKTFKHRENEIIEKLSEDKNLQLNYIECLLQSRIKITENEEAGGIMMNQEEEEDEENIKYLLGLHIKLLCELEKFDEIVPALKASSLYPFQECLDYCEKSSAYKGCIFLYLKKADSSKALELCKKKINDVIKRIIKNINNENSNEEQNKLLNEFDGYLDDGKYVCECGGQETEDLWFDLLQVLYTYEGESDKELKKHESDQDKYNSAKELCLHIIKDIKELLEKMCSYVSIKRIMEVLSKKNQNAGFKEFKELLVKILANYDNLSNIFVSARNLLTNLVLENENSFQILNLKGELLNFDKCDKCQKSFNKNLNNNKEKVVVFSCNHIYHRNCVKIERTKYGNEPVCPVCRELEIGVFSEEGSSLIKSNTTIIEDKQNENNQFQVNVSFDSRRMIRKLQKFDNKYFEGRKMLTDCITDYS